MPNEQHSIHKHSPGFVIPAGTQVVLRQSKPLDGSDSYKKPGAVGFVARCPGRADGNYLVEFTDGATVEASFDELSMRRAEVDNELAVQSDLGLDRYVIYKCMVGSKAYGLDNDDSDDDIRGIFLPPAKMHWSLFELPGQLEDHANGNDEVFWEFEKYVRLSLKANPNVLEVMWTPIVLEANDIAKELLALRSSFLSKHLYKTYSGYVLSQFRRMKNAFEKTGKYKSKHAMHLIRLLLSGINALNEHEIMIDVSQHRDELLKIRRGERSFEEVRQQALSLDREFQTAFEKTTLPEQPNFAVIDDLLVRARRSMVE
jgi:hypothetical protein